MAMRTCLDCKKTLANHKFAGRAKVCRTCSDTALEDLKQRMRLGRTTPSDTPVYHAHTTDEDD